MLRNSQHDMPSDEKQNNGEATNFQSLYCEWFHVAPEQFVDDVFWNCIHEGRKPAAKFLRMLCDGIFSADFELIYAVGRSRNMETVKSNLAEFRHYHKPRGLVRKNLRVRISGQKITDLANQLFRGPLPRKTESNRPASAGSSN